MSPDFLCNKVYIASNSMFTTNAYPDYDKPDLPLLYLRDNFPIKYNHFNLYYNDAKNQPLLKELYE